jgi:hypothetical protein
MFSKLSPFQNFEKFTLDLSEKMASSQYVESLHAHEFMQIFFYEKLSQIIHAYFSNYIFCVGISLFLEPILSLNFDFGCDRDPNSPYSL